MHACLLNSFNARQMYFIHAVGYLCRSDPHGHLPQGGFQEVKGTSSLGRKQHPTAIGKAKMEQNVGSNNFKSLVL